MSFFSRKPNAEDLAVDKPLSTDEKERIEQLATALFLDQWKYYRDAFHIVLKCAFFEALLICVLIFVLVILVMQGIPDPKYFSVDPEGRITKLEPISEPVLADEQIRTFVRDAVAASFTFNYLDFEQRIPAAIKFYTDKGYQSHVEAIRSSGLLAQVLEKKLMLKTSVDGVPIIQDKIVQNGRHIWVVRVDLTRTLTDRVKSQDSRASYLFYLTRVPSTERVQQVAIYLYTQDMGMRR